MFAATKGSMAARRGDLVYVGGASVVGNFGTGGSISFSSVTGGVGSPQAGDLAIAVYTLASVSDCTAGMPIRTSGVNYTLIGSGLYANATADANMRVGYRVIQSGDTSVSFVVSAGSSGDAFVGLLQIWRNADPVVLDVTPTTSTGIDNGQPDPAAISPLTLGTKIFVAGHTACQNSSSSVFTASYLSDFVTARHLNTRSGVAGIGAVDWPGGAYDPAAFGGGSSQAGDSWAALTFAIRPA